ncbi:hypothetical protein HPB51_002235 [Rhipicephalus microplus]|uniref:Uncharacterized protein n=1 Tax=Rhipicephalus microplus TaxID=6941 RepID=A0A9J6EWI4_RHIMP|nr:hypothetical protein HPB51_002235 [Rhipicephalus microplus]
MSDEDKVGHLLKGIAEDVYNFLITKENLNTPSIFRQQCRAFEALKTRRILPKFGRLDNVPTVASMDVATCEDISYLVRRVVREELVRLQAGDVHHQCSFAACPEPPPYWMRERHVENRPRTETADFTPRLPFSPDGSWPPPDVIISTCRCGPPTVVNQASTRRLLCFITKCSCGARPASAYFCHLCSG